MGAQDKATGCWYFGEYEYTVDSQRRVAIPRSWRGDDAEANHFFLLPGRDSSLQLVPAVMFEELLVKLRKVSFADSRAAVGLATIGSMAQDCTCDRQGRISLTPRLMEHAEISEKVVMIGAVATIQIWNPQVWSQKRIDSDSGLDVIQAIQERGDDLGDILSQAVRTK